jgi:Arc/MetJ family transcription regulator
MLDKDSKFKYYRIMKTTIDIPEKELQEAIRHVGAKTKKDAIVMPLRTSTEDTDLLNSQRCSGHLRTLCPRRI